MREPDAGRYVHLRPRRLRPECLDRVEALADEHGIDRDIARRAAPRRARARARAACAIGQWLDRGIRLQSAVRWHCPARSRIG
jgi:hypothetical protein